MIGTDEESDAELAARAARGEDHAFTLLMRRHKGGLYGFVRRYVGDADAAYEIVQESFVAAWRALSRYDGLRPFGAWLRAIALNKCRDRGRRNTVRRIILGEKDAESPEAQRQADPSPDAESVLVSVQRRAALDAAIAKLPAKLKEPLILTYFEELSQQEAGRLLGVSAKTVETRVYRARQKLAQILDLDAE
ncbi:RNA polymerase sigma factor [Phenylobacterium sp.]|uniref:RNA polymerase sigma factor n=1 Tax=Phenylobacterium sp. TaxID=1871053 RepID=UPI002737237C|nr:RNA polymerase sigma factor [Phenylobacterium sp.]MDP3853344.1 RNA polymerase sigma factor [Phenylobacterium sp.]